MYFLQSYKKNAFFYSVNILLLLYAANRLHSPSSRLFEHEYSLQNDCRIIATPAQNPDTINLSTSRK